ncbi:MAG: sugar kinase [Spirochaetales bacterium]
MNRSIDILSYGEPLVGFYPHFCNNKGDVEKPERDKPGDNRIGDGAFKSPQEEPKRKVLESNHSFATLLPPAWQATWGGDTSNLALASSKLGLRVSYLTRIGKDLFGEGFLSLWQTHQIGTEWVQIDPEHPTGLYFASFLGKTHSLTYYRKDSAACHIKASEFPVSVLDSVRIFHLSGISLSISPIARDFGVFLMMEAKKRGVVVSFDVNYRSPLLRPEEAKRFFPPLIRNYVDIVSFTQEEVEILGGLDSQDKEQRGVGNLAERFPGPSYHLLKRGSEGAFLWGPEGSCDLPAYPVQVVDTVGAGDAFLAGFLYAYLRGLPLAQAGKFASAVAALVCTGMGPLEKQPTLAEVQDFLAARNPQDT